MIRSRIKRRRVPIRIGADSVFSRAAMGVRVLRPGNSRNKLNHNQVSPMKIVRKVCCAVACWSNNVEAIKRRGIRSYNGLKNHNKKIDQNKFGINQTTMNTGTARTNQPASNSHQNFLARSAPAPIASKFVRCRSASLAVGMFVTAYEQKVI